MWSRGLTFFCVAGLILIFPLLYIGGFFDGIDKGMCLKSHKEPYQWTQQIWVGNISCGKDCYIPLYNYVTHDDIRDVCDEWEK